MRPHRSNDLTRLLAIISALFLTACSDSSSSTKQETPAASEQPEVVTNKPKPDLLPENLPATFTDHVQGYNKKQVPFTMILVPGDNIKGIKPIYAAETEVTWEMFLRWMYCEDLSGENYSAKNIAELIQKELRPSPVWEEFPPLHMARGESDWLRHPAMGMNWRMAKAYCTWLSEKTGKQYRLPTDDEWTHLLNLGGGIPKNKRGITFSGISER
jgi:hypothetical protein